MMSQDDVFGSDDGLDNILSNDSSADISMSDDDIAQIIGDDSNGNGGSSDMPVSPEDYNMPSNSMTGSSHDAIYDIPVNVSAVLGKASMQVSQLLKLGRGAVVELDRRVGDAIDIYVNNRLVARGEVVVVDDRLAVNITQLIKLND